MPGEYRVVIDTDPGIDDAVAILLALTCPEFDVLGLTTVAGNIGLGTTTRNAGRILALAQRPDIPVIAGAAAPLARKGIDVGEIHGDDGLGGVAFPEPAAPAVAEDAVAWLAGHLLREPAGAIDLLALGPLTNLARLIERHPEAARRVRRVVAMGGAIDEPGNAGSGAEFNLATDPEAAAIVLRAGLPLTLIPLDVTRRVRATRADTERLAAASKPGARAAGALIEAYFQSTASGAAVRESRPLHDPCVMLYCLAPHLFEIERLHLSIDTSAVSEAGSLSRHPAGHAVDVAMKVNGSGALATLLERLLAT